MNRTLNPALKTLIPLIFILALFAAGMGLFYQQPGEPYPLTTFRGEQVMINGRGLYFYDTVSSAAQMQGNDFVTLLVGLPLLAISAWMAFHTRPGGANALRSRLLLAGTLGFFLYTYMSMAFLTAYNRLFLVYVTLFSLSLIALILALVSLEVEALPGYFSERLPRRGIAAFLMATGLLLLFAWLGRIVPPLLQGGLPVLENTTTLVIQALDLGLIVPLAFLAGILLLRRSPWGYLLASIAVMKIVTMGLAVFTMGINMARAGTPESTGLVVAFGALTLINLVLAYLLLKNIQEPGRAYASLTARKSAAF